MSSIAKKKALQNEIAFYKDDTSGDDASAELDQLSQSADDTGEEAAQIREMPYGKGRGGRRLVSKKKPPVKLDEASSNQFDINEEEQSSDPQQVLNKEGRFKPDSELYFMRSPINFESKIERNKQDGSMKRNIKQTDYASKKEGGKKLKLKPSQVAGYQQAIGQMQNDMYIVKSRTQTESKNRKRSLLKAYNLNPMNKQMTAIGGNSKQRPIRGSAARLGGPLILVDHQNQMASDPRVPLRSQQTSISNIQETRFAAGQFQRKRVQSAKTRPSLTNRKDSGIDTIENDMMNINVFGNPFQDEDQLNSHIEDEDELNMLNLMKSRPSKSGISHTASFKSNYQTSNHALTDMHQKSSRLPDYTSGDVVDLIKNISDLKKLNNSYKDANLKLKTQTSQLKNEIKNNEVTIQRILKSQQSQDEESVYTQAIQSKNMQMGQIIQFRSALREQRIENAKLKRELQHISKSVKMTKLGEMQTENRELKAHGKEMNVTMRKMHTYMINLKEELKKAFQLMQEKKYVQAEYLIGSSLGIYMEETVQETDSSEQSQLLKQAQEEIARLNQEIEEIKESSSQDTRKIRLDLNQYKKIAQSADQKNQELQKMIFEKDQQLKTSQNDAELIKELQLFNNQLRKQVQETQSQVRKLNKDLDQSKKQSEKTEKDIQKQNSILKEKIQEFEQLFQVNVKQLHDKEKEANVLSNKLKISQSKIDDLVKQLEIAKTRPVKNLDAQDYDNQVENNPNLNQEKASLEKELIEIRQSLQQKEAQITQTLEANKMIESIKIRLEEQLLLKHEEYNKAQQQLKQEHQNALQQITVQMQAVKDKLAQSDAKILEQINNSSNQDNQEVQQLTQDKQQLSGQVQEQFQEIDLLKQQLEEVQQELNQFKQVDSRNPELLQTGSIDTIGRNQIAEDYVEGLTDVLQFHQKQSKNQNKEEELQIQIDAQNTELEQIKKSMEEYIQTNEQLNAELEDLREQVENAQNQVMTQWDTFNEQKSELILDHQKQMQDAQTDFQAQLATWQNKHNEINSQLQQLQSSENQYKSQIQELQYQIQNINGQANQNPSKEQLNEAASQDQQPLKKQTTIDEWGDMSTAVKEIQITLDKKELKSKNLNKLSNEELAAYKRAMDKDFEMKQLKVGDPGFQYDKVVVFTRNDDEPLEDDSWDDDDDNDAGQTVEKVEPVPELLKKKSTQPNMEVMKLRSEILEKLRYRLRIDMQEKVKKIAKKKEDKEANGEYEDDDFMDAFDQEEEEVVPEKEAPKKNAPKQVKFAEQAESDAGAADTELNAEVAALETAIASNDQKNQSNDEVAEMKKQMEEERKQVASQIKQLESDIFKQKKEKADMFKALDESKRKLRSSESQKAQFDQLWNDYQALEHTNAKLKADIEEKKKEVEDLAEQKKTVEFRLEKLTELAHQLNEKIIAKNQRLKEYRNEVRQKNKQLQIMNPNEQENEKEVQEEYVKGTVVDGVVGTMEDKNAQEGVKKVENIDGHYTKGEKRVSITIDKHYNKVENSSDEFGDLE